jgi:hypothetical protein
VNIINRKLTSVAIVVAVTAVALELGEDNLLSDPVPGDLPPESDPVSGPNLTPILMLILSLSLSG